MKTGRRKTKQEWHFKHSKDGVRLEVVSVGHDAFWFHKRLLNVIEPSFREIVIHADPHDLDLSSLEICTDLESFRLSNAPDRPRHLWSITDSTSSIDFSPLSKCKTLEEIHVLTGVPQLDLSFASSCPNLRRVVVRHIARADGKPKEHLDLQALEECGTLEELHIGILGGLHPDLQFFRRCQSLSRVKLDIQIGDTQLPVDFTYFSFLDNLEELEIKQESKRGLSKPDLLPLKHCQRLKKLCLHFTKYSGRPAVDEIDLTCVVGISELEHIEIVGVRTIHDFLPLSLCENLKTIEIRKTDLSTIDLSPLTDCQKLESIKIRYNYRPAKIVLPRLDNHPHMRSILVNTFHPEKKDIREHGETVIDLEPLSCCLSLRELNLRGNQTLSSLDLSPLYGLTDLEFLDISANMIKYDDWDLEPLIGCTSLRYLFIENRPTHITGMDEGHGEYIRAVEFLDVTPLFEASSLEVLVVTELEPDRLSLRKPSDRNYAGHTYKQLFENEEGYWFPWFRDAVGELYPRLIADSSRVPKPKRSPRWLSPYQVEWYREQ